MAVYASKFPLEIPALLKYAEIVRDIASRKPGRSFLYYDTQFRQARETSLLSWDRIHTEFWLMACTAFQQPSVISNRPFRTTQGRISPQGRISQSQNASVRIHVGRTIDNPAAVIRNVASPTYAATAKAATLRSHANSPPKSKHHVQPPVHQPDSLLSTKDQKPPTTPIKICKLSPFLVNYPLSDYIIQGFSRGFKLGYIGSRNCCSSPNLKSCSDFPDIALKKLQKEVSSGRIKGPFHNPPFPNLHISPIGLVPKKDPGKYRLIHHLSYPGGSSINDFIDQNLATVSYATFDDAVQKVLLLGRGT